jgi:hypothetical protein
MPTLLNLELMKSWQNWVTIFAMCAFAILLLHLIVPEDTSQ